MAQYRVPVLENYAFQPPVEDKDLTAAPGTPSKGDRYLVAVGGTATGDWATHENDIAWFDGTNWQYDTPAEGHMIYVKDEDEFYLFTTSWIKLQDATGDMFKSVYDTNDDGIVDKAEALDDGTNSKTAAQVATHIDDATKHREINDSGTAVTDLWSASKINQEINSKVQGLDWQDSVLDKDLNAPPGTPSADDRYIVGGTPTGDWSGQANNIAEYDGTSWSFETSNEGFAVWVEDEDKLYVFNGTAWVKFGSTLDHDQLQNIGTNSHADIDTHIADASKHREINDSGTAATDLWSADKIITELATKQDNLTFGNGLDEASGTVTVNNSEIINDAGTGSSDIWSADKIITELADKADKVSGAVNGNLASLDANGNLVDSGVAGTNVFDVSANDLDDINDGTTYGKVKNTELNSGFVTQINDGTNVATAAEAKTAYDRRAQYDSDLGVILFDNL